MDRAPKLVSAALVVVIVLLTASCVINAVTGKAEVAILEAFTIAAWVGILIAWRWFNRRGETKPK